MECSNRFLPFGHFEWVSRLFWAKKGCFGAENTQFWEGTSRLGAPSPAPLVTYWVRTCSWQGHHLGSMARVE